jgi:hypothetical protein
MTVILFPRKTSNHQWNAARKLKEHARTAINADEETIVTVSESDCGDPLCGARTIVLIMHPRRPTEAVKIDKPLEQVTQADLSDALAPLAAQSGPARAPSPARGSMVTRTDQSKIS